MSLLGDMFGRLKSRAVAEQQAKRIDPNPQHKALDGSPGSGAGARDDADNSDLLLMFQDWWKAARDHWHDWRTECETNDAYVAGEQWSDDDLNVLREQLRPAVTFNRIGPFLDGVSGLEIQNRQETRYIPRTVGQSGVSDLLTAAAKWVRDECDAEDEESDMFLDAIKCGMGWTQTSMEYDDDPDGNIIVCQINPMEMWPDPGARRRNLMDMRYVFRVRDLPIDTVREMFPDHSDDEIDAGWARDTQSEADDPHNAREAAYYVNDQAGQEARDRKTVRLVEIEWWEYETGYKMIREGSRTERVSKEEHDDRQASAKSAGMPEIPSTKDRRKRYRRALVGGVVLKVMDGAKQGGFTFKCMTGKRDRKNGTWYGMVRAMRDPQDWANKWLSQTLHIINSNSKGGLIAELDAFENPHEAEDSWSDPQSIVWVRPGALTQGKLKEQEPMTYPAGLQQLMEYAVNSIPAVTGFSPEMMGMVDREQAGVTEMGRKQQGMTLLAGYFDGLRRYRKEQGRLMLWMIQEFISDGRLIRVGGPENAQYIQLIRDPHLLEYDVVVDDTPTSPNMKERVWAALTQLFPLFSKIPGLPPQVYLDMLEYSPLPATLVAKVNKTVTQAQQAGPHTDPVQQAVAASENAKAQVHQATAQKLQAETALLPQKMQLDALAQQAKIEVDRSNAVKNLAGVGLGARSQQLDEAELAADTLLQAHKQIHDVRQGDQAAAMQQQGMAQDGALQANQQAQQGMQADRQHQLAQDGQQQAAVESARAHDLAQQQAQQPDGA